MGLFDFLKTMPTQTEKQQFTHKDWAMVIALVLAKLICGFLLHFAPDERQYYRPDDYYTTYSYPWHGRWQEKS